MPKILDLLPMNTLNCNKLTLFPIEIDRNKVKRQFKIPLKCLNKTYIYIKTNFRRTFSLYQHLDTYLKRKFQNTFTIENKGNIISCVSILRNWSL